MRLLIESIKSFLAKNLLPHFGHDDSKVIYSANFDPNDPVPPVINIDLFFNIDIDKLSIIYYFLFKIFTIILINCVYFFCEIIIS